MFRKFWAFWLTLAVVVTPQATIAQTIDELRQQGEAAYNSGNYAQAELIWRRVINQKPDSVAYVWLGIALRNQGKLPEAVQSYRRALQLDPEYALAHYNLGLALYDQGKLPEAVQSYRRALQLDPEYAAAHNNLGLALSDQGKLPEAVQSYRRALQLDPEYAAAHNNLGLALSDQGKLPEAVQSYRRALQLDPEYALAHYNLGLALYDQGKLPEAVQSYRRALELDPEDAGAHNNLGIALRQQDKPTEAIEAYYQALSLPNKQGRPWSAHTLAHNNLGYALQQQGDLQGAIAEYKKSLQIDPNFTTAQNNLREAERFLAQQRTPPPPSDLAYVPSPEEEPLVYEMRSTVRIITENSQGKDYGTGWIFKREGETIWIMTNRHVIQHGNRPSETIQVEFFSTLDYNQRTPYPATLEHITRPGDPLDLAVIKVEGIRADDDTIRPLKFHSGAIPRTQPVTIIGHPNNLADPWNVVIGNVTNVNLNSHKMTLDANLASGNSGGPILNSETNEVIGIVIQLITTEGIDTDPNIATPDIPENPIATRGFGFGHPIDSVVEQLRRWRVIN
ncbi:tetratricopeptide repeat protein [Roseofilum capinflatum]|uniref:Tetratricopeptide repeat protein n=1 Tax=Roseofilum capinflatum BLCC-M114 TaxID=3022440 RepID=A0ABT7B834_9CYAN|nr:tetratricopeptide repeat protein [Roseofilum capinflatum]MDJ1175316.1 tetratricopeptide repeat protein [Roseofilum capinflatum BLCC-M114]